MWSPFEEGAVVGLAPRDDGGREPPRSYLSQQVRPVTRHHDLIAPAPHGQGRDQVGERGRVLVDERSSQRDCALDALFDPRFAAKGAGAEQSSDRDRVGGRDSAVEKLLGPDDQGFRVAARREEATRRVVPEQVDQLGGRLQRPLAPESPAGPFRQAGAGVGQPGIVSGDSQVPRPATLPAAHQPPVGVHRRPQEVDDLLGPAAVVVDAGGRRDFRQGGPRHGIPFGQHLLVACRLHAFRPGRRQQGPGLFHLGRAPEGCSNGAHGNGAPLPVALFGDPVPRRGGPDEVSRQQLTQLVEREGRMPALHPAGVGIEGRVQRAFGCRQIAEDEVEGLGHHAEIVPLPLVLPCVQVGPGQERLVGEHLLEVWHEPVCVRGVPAEPADEVIVDTAGGHGVEGPHAHVARLVGARAAARARRRHNSTRVGRGNLGAGPKPPHSGSKPAVSPVTTCDRAASGSRPIVAAAPNDGSL